MRQAWQTLIDSDGNVSAAMTDRVAEWLSYGIPAGPHELRGWRGGIAYAS